MARAIAVAVTLPLRALHDPDGAVAFVSCAMERDGVVYTGSFRDPSIVAVPLD